MQGMANWCMSHTYRIPSAKGTARMKQEEEDLRIASSKRGVRNMEGRNSRTKGKGPKQGLTSAEQLSTEYQASCSYCPNNCYFSCILSAAHH